jgi:hypothetical protein
MYQHQRLRKLNTIDNLLSPIRNVQTTQQQITIKKLFLPGEVDTVVTLHSIATGREQNDTTSRRLKWGRRIANPQSH